MREVEVLHDQLIRFFIDHPDEEPASVLIMVRDVKRYSPLISAVFGESGAIPFSVADHLQDEDAAFYDLLSALFEFAKSRFTVSDLFALIENPVIRSRFDLTDDVIELLGQCAEEASIRWGYDGTFKERLFGLPPTEENTWRRGIDRLLLGSIMIGGDLFNGIGPVEKIEGSDLDSFASFIELIELLKECHGFMNGNHTFQEWREVLSHILLGYLTGNRMKTSGRLIEALKRLEGSADDHPVPAEIIEREIANYYGDVRMGGGFLSGGVTFSEITPMRSVPASFIGFLGLNEENFPARDSGPSFDLILKEPRFADRFIRKDDRQLFLESILLAKRALYISYIGKNIQNNRRVEPSPVVSELTDYLRRNFELNGHPYNPLREHHLHGFHPAYFQEGGDLFSYSKKRYRSAVATHGVRRQPAPFHTGELRPTTDEMPEVTFHELNEFLGNPSRYFLKSLGIRPRKSDGERSDTEEFSLGGLESYKIAESFEKLCIDQGLNEERARLLIKASDVLPHGSMESTALLLLREKYDDYLKLVNRLVREVGAGERSISTRISLDSTGPLYAADFRVHTTGDTIYLFRPTRIKPRDRLRAWLIHLTMNASGENPDGYVTHLYGVDRSGIAKGIFTRVGMREARDRLIGVVGLYLKGREKPIPLFPEASYEYSIKLNVSEKSDSEKSGNEALLERALAAAKNRWKNDFKLIHHPPADSEDESIRICFRESDPFERKNPEALREFQETAKRIYTPVLENYSEGPYEP
jgi:exodeoxyribonuclease V gamma subunit